MDETKMTVRGGRYNMNGSRTEAIKSETIMIWLDRNGTGARQTGQEWRVRNGT